MYFLKVDNVTQAVRGSPETFFKFKPKLKGHVAEAIGSHKSGSGVIGEIPRPTTKEEGNRLFQTLRKDPRFQKIDDFFENRKEMLGLYRLDIAFISYNDGKDWDKLLLVELRKGNLLEGELTQLRQDYRNEFLKVKQ